MSLVPNIDALQNFNFIIALGIVGLLLLFCASLLSLRRKITRFQKHLERLSEDVEGLRIAEETRLFTELNRFGHNNVQAESAPILAAIDT